MIFIIDNNNGNAFQIDRTTEARFTKFDRKYKRLMKQYTSSTGETITYGQRSHVETIDFTIECSASDYANFWSVINGIYEYTIKYDFDDNSVDEKSGNKYFLSAGLTEKLIYNANGRLWTVSGTFEEV